MLVAGILVLVILLIIIGTVQMDDKGEDLPEWAQDKPQDVDKIQDIKVAMPLHTQDYSIFYLDEQDMFNVDYGGFNSFEKIEAQVIIWFMQNTEYDKVTIKYNSVGGRQKTYDLSKELTEILPENEFVQPRADQPYLTVETAE